MSNCYLYSAVNMNHKTVCVRVFTAALMYKVMDTVHPHLNITVFTVTLTIEIVPLSRAVVRETLISFE